MSHGIYGLGIGGTPGIGGGTAPGGATNDLARAVLSVNADGYLAPATRGEFRVDAELDLGPAAFFRIAVDAAEE